MLPCSSDYIFLMPSKIFDGLCEAIWTIFEQAQTGIAPAAQKTPNGFSAMIVVHCQSRTASVREMRSADGASAALLSKQFLVLSLRDSETLLAQCNDHTIFALTPIGVGFWSVIESIQSLRGHTHATDSH